MVIPWMLDKLKEAAKEKSKILDHLGLVMGMCKELKLIEIIDEVLPDANPDKIISNGTGVVAMILNGLGFVNKRLYMVDYFFEKTPVSKLFEVPYLKAAHFNDDSLGRVLDSIYAYGVTELYHIISHKTMKYLKEAHNLDCNIGHLDNSTMHLHGSSYPSLGEGESMLEIVPGYSKDNRPDLNQVGIQLIVESKSRIPVLFRALSGNKEEGKSYKEAISNHIDALQNDQGLKWVIADSKLYNQGNIKELNLHSGIDWLTRVPSSIKEARELKDQLDKTQLQKVVDRQGYSYMELGSIYGGVNHRWVLIHSEEKEKRDIKTLNKLIIRQSAKREKALASLSRQEFDSIPQAIKATKKFAKSLKYNEISSFELVSKDKYEKAGKPPKGAIPLKTVYLIKATLAQNEEKLTHLRSVQGSYIMATSEKEEEKLSVSLLIEIYKDQASVERGFRFLKDPMIMGSSLFLQKPERIMALLMIMTLCLLVYSALEFKIRALLKQTGKTIKGRVKKPTNNPSLKWIFEVFHGIHYSIKPNSSEVLNLELKHLEILELLGKNYWKYYT